MYGIKQFILFSKLKTLKGPLKELNKKEFGIFLREL